jgi:hypothetical protein
MVWCAANERLSIKRMEYLENRQSLNSLLKFMPTLSVPSPFPEGYMRRWQVVFGMWREWLQASKSAPRLTNF